jgi:hypothetical protein
MERLRHFREGWARPRDTRVSARAHYFKRHELGEAVSLCEYDFHLLAADLRKPGEAVRCARCKTALLRLKS